MHKINNCTNCIENKKSVFSILSKKEKDKLIEHHSCYYYKKNEIIFREGGKPTDLICLSDGKVKIFKEGVGGREQIIRMAKPVGFIGYRAIFADENYMSSAIAIENSTVCKIEKDALFNTIKNNSAFAMEIIKALASELGFSNKRTVALTQKHIRGRLAESLILLKDTYGFEDDGSTLKIYLSREDIANLSNMTTSNAIRTLSIFSSEGVLNLEGRKIKILDLHQLERISELG